MTTQIPDQSPRDQYVASSGQTIFPYTFLVFEDSDISVTKNGVELSLNIDYTVSDVGDVDGGNVSLDTGANDGDLIVIFRNMPLDRETKYQENGDFEAETVNEDFDRIILMLQQISIGNQYGVQLNPSDDISELNLPFYLPSKSDRSLKVLGFDGFGNSVAVDILQAGTSDASLVNWSPDALLDLTSVSVKNGLDALYFNAFNKYYIGSGVNNADIYAVTPLSSIPFVTPSPTNYDAGAILEMLPSSANTTDTPKVNVGGLGNRDLKMPDGSNTPIGFIDPSMGLYKYLYNGSFYQFAGVTIQDDNTIKELGGSKIKQKTLPVSALVDGTPGHIITYDIDTGEAKESEGVYRYWRDFGSLSMAGQSEAEFLDIPASCTKIRIVGSKLSSVATDQSVLLQVGIGPTPNYIDSGYEGSIQVVRDDASDTTPWSDNVPLSVIYENQNNTHFDVTLTRRSGSSVAGWTANATGGFRVNSSDHGVTSSGGYIEDSLFVSDLSAVRVYLANGENFDFGEVFIEIYAGEV